MKLRRKYFSFQDGGSHEWFALGGFYWVEEASCILSLNEQVPGIKFNYCFEKFRLRLEVDYGYSHSFLGYPSPPFPAALWKGYCLWQRWLLTLTVPGCPALPGGGTVGHLFIPFYLETFTIYNLTLKAYASQVRLGLKTVKLICFEVWSDSKISSWEAQR